MDLLHHLHPRSFSVTFWLLISDSLPSGLLRSHVGNGSRSVFHTDYFSLFISPHITWSKWPVNSQHGYHTQDSKPQIKPSGQVFTKWLLFLILQVLINSSPFHLYNIYCKKQSLICLHERKNSINMMKIDLFPLVLRLWVTFLGYIRKQMGHTKKNIFYIIIHIPLYTLCIYLIFIIIITFLFSSIF